jgi:hypothetical protein
MSMRFCFTAHRDGIFFAIFHRAVQSFSPPSTAK